MKMLRDDETSRQFQAHNDCWSCLAMTLNIKPIIPSFQTVLYLPSWRHVENMT